MPGQFFLRFCGGENAAGRSSSRAATRAALDERGGSGSPRGRCGSETKSVPAARSESASERDVEAFIATARGA